jgi:hypothetical protein
MKPAPYSHFPVQLRHGLGWSIFNGFTKDIPHGFVSFFQDKVVASQVPNRHQPLDHSEENLGSSVGIHILSDFSQFDPFGDDPFDVTEVFIQYLENFPF